MPSDNFYARLSMALGDRGLRWAGKLNVPVYRLTRGRLMNKVGRAPVLLLTSIGRKSGEPRTAPVLYLEHDGRYVVIGTNAGNKRTPAWAHNLRATPDAEIQVGAKKLRVSARVAEGEEREDLWRRSNEQYAGFDTYLEKLDRDVSVFVLEPR
jgi:deazaflavin-dependent oxidoreductase (nitroreductase family)